MHDNGRYVKSEDAQSLLDQAAPLFHSLLHRLHERL